MPAGAPSPPPWRPPPPSVAPATGGGRRGAPAPGRAGGQAEPFGGGWGAKGSGPTGAVVPDRLAVARMGGTVPRGASRPWTPPPPRGHHRWWWRAAAAVGRPVGPRRGGGGRPPAPHVAVAEAVGGCWVTSTAAGWGSSSPVWDGGAHPDGGTTFFVVGLAHCVLGGMVDEWGGGRQQAAVLRGQKPTTPPDRCDWRGELKVTTSTGRRTDGGEDVVHLCVPSCHGATGGAGEGKARPPAPPAWCPPQRGGRVPRPPPTTSCCHSWMGGAGAAGVGGRAPPSGPPTSCRPRRRGGGRGAE